jgi:hypothetical protein
MIIDAMTATDKVEYYKKLLELERLTLASVTEQRDRLERELDEVREKLADWENSAAHVEADHPDEVHCSCVPILRKLLCDARLERDEAVNNYETAVLREHRMQDQRDRLAGAFEEYIIYHERYGYVTKHHMRKAESVLAAVKGGRS